MRSVRWHGIGELAFAAMFVLVGARSDASGLGPGLFLGGALALVSAFVGVRTLRVAVILDRERIVSRNVWATTWIAGPSITEVHVEERGRSSLLSWGLDTSFPVTWVPLDVVVIEGAGRRMIADALRSDRRVHRTDEPTETVARIRAGAIEQWRAAWWRAEGVASEQPPNVP